MTTQSRRPNNENEENEESCSRVVVEGPTEVEDLGARIPGLGAVRFDPERCFKFWKGQIPATAEVSEP